ARRVTPSRGDWSGAERTRRAARERSVAPRTESRRARGGSMARPALHNAPSTLDAYRGHHPRPHVLHQSRVAPTFEGRLLSTSHQVLDATRSRRGERERV